MISVFDGFELVEGASFLFENEVGGLGPDEWFWIGIVAVEVVMDLSFQLRHASEDAAPDALGGDLGEEPLDQIEPGRARWREMHLEATTFGEPRLHLGRLVRPVVVDHEMDVEVPLHAPVDPLQETDELWRDDAAGIRR